MSMRSFKNSYNYFRLFLSLAHFWLRPKSRYAIHSLGDTADEMSQEDCQNSKYPFRLPTRSSISHSILDPRSSEFATLEKYSPETLGYQYWKAVQTWSLKSYRWNDEDGKLRGETRLIRKQIREVHDVWHVVTGIGFTEHDELTLQAFCLAQYMNLMSVFLIATSLLKTALKRDYTQIQKIMANVSRGYQMGQQAEPLMGQNWNLLLKENLKDVRAQLKLNP